MKKENWEKWISFLSWVNKLSPWNLWHPQKWQEEKERIKREIEERSKIERKKGWHITDIEQCRQFIDDILNLT